ncbi:MAG: DUF4347 domain-containing protein [Elainella sp.]
MCFSMTTMMTTINKENHINTQVANAAATVNRPGKARIAVAQSRELAVIDGALTDITQLVAAARSGVEIAVLDASQSGIAQISQILRQHHDLTALHIVSHGAAGQLFLGQAELGLETLSDHAATLQSWVESFAPEAELLIYGCEVALGDRGRAFVARINELTGASVAASETKTGAAALGGDWQLQVQTGQVKTPLMFEAEAIADYQAILAPGSLDPAFGTGGVVITDFGDASADANEVIVQPDGKLVVVGTTFPDNGNNDFVLTRYNSDGTLDTGFGNNGKITIDINGEFDIAGGVVLQSDGKLVVTGFTGVTLDGFRRSFFALLRYNSDGTPDTSFGDNGKVMTDFGGTSQPARGIIQQSDGKLVVTGSRYLFGEQFALARYNSDGSLDTSFGDDGKVTTDFGAFLHVSFSVAQQSDGKLVAGGYTLSTLEFRNDFILARYNSDGTVDASFGDNGRVVTDFNNEDNVATSIVLQSDGKVVAAGYNQNASGTYDFALVRYNSDGTLDTSFGIDGKITTDFNNQNDFANSIVLQNDGKLVVAGAARNAAGNNDFALARYNSDGTLDTSFGIDGKIITDLDGKQDGGSSIALQSDGKLVVAGGSDGKFAIVRYFGASIEGTAGNDSITGTDNDDLIYGLEGNDTLSGGAGNDVLDGGVGNDRMLGGRGNDAYVVDSTSDIVREVGGEGTDTVQTGLSYRLGASIENLTLTGTAAVSGTGNGANNIITGNGASNTLSGLIGNDRLDGGAGDDTMLGGLGNDTYLVDSGGDAVTELSNEGTDTVQSSVSYGLSANIENLILTGADAINGSGNELANRMTGNLGNNFLSGGAGNDTIVGGAGDDFLLGELGDDSMSGGLGNDVYVVDSLGDVIVERSNQGFDIVQSSVSYSLSAGIEYLALDGIGDINATGNNLANTLLGNDGNNVLTGGAGNDDLIGGAGSDQFAFGSGAAFSNATLGRDTIFDFTAGTDKIGLSKTTFAALTSAVGDGFSDASEFAIVRRDGAASSSTAKIVYNSANGKLFYNQNGTAAGLGTGGTFAVLNNNPTLTASDFVIQA